MAPRPARPADLIDTIEALEAALYRHAVERYPATLADKDARSAMREALDSFLIGNLEE